MISPQHVFGVLLRDIDQEAVAEEVAADKEGVAHRVAVVEIDEDAGFNSRYADGEFDEVSVGSVIGGADGGVVDQRRFDPGGGAGGGGDAEADRFADVLAWVFI